MRIKIFIALLIVSCYSFKASAWGNKGHEIIAQITWYFLDSASRQKLVHYLGGMTIEQASTWMNDMEKDSNYAYMRSWHYFQRNADSPFYTTAQHCCPPENIQTLYPKYARQVNIITKLQQVIAELEHKNELPDSIVKRDLLIFIGLEADIYDPLNVGIIYGDTLGKTTIFVHPVDYIGSVLFKRPFTIRQMWDSVVISYDHITAQKCLPGGMRQPTENPDLSSNFDTNVIMWTYIPNSALRNDVRYANRSLGLDSFYWQSIRRAIPSLFWSAGLKAAAVLQHVLKE